METQNRSQAHSVQNQPDATIACSFCQTRNRSIAKFCKECGEIIKRAAESETSANYEINLDGIVGLENVKRSIAEIINRVKILNERKSKGFPVSQLYLHSVFKGDTGTGKTMIGAYFAQEFKKIGALSKGTILEIDNETLLKEGQNLSASIRNWIDKARGGVLFFDEMHKSIESISTIVKGMSIAGDDIIIIIAGMKEPLDKYFEENKEEKQRIGMILDFSNYTEEELLQITLKKLKSYQYKITEKAVEILQDYIRISMYSGKCAYKNAWLVEREIIPRLLNRQSNRLAESGDYSEESLTRIIDADIPDEDIKRKTPEEVLVAMDKLVGMDNIKNEIKKLAQSISIRKEQQKSGIAGADIGVHMVFTGNPGTGKTTVARIVGDLLKAIGLLPSGHIVEVDRKDLVGQYIGETAIKTTSILDRAMGGVLFIDEAYSLSPKDGGKDFGQEAIDTILKRMEDDRGKFVVIAAGYKDEMERFITSNPGLKSRFTSYFHLEDYKPEELYRIFCIMAKNSGFIITEEAGIKAEKSLEDIYNKRDKNFANGRTVRNLFEETTRELASRLSEMVPEERTPDKLNMITPDDIPYVIDEQLSVEEIIGKLDSLVGMNSIKDEMEKLAHAIRIRKEQQAAGIQGADIGVHMVFTGNPGTGKTTVARIVGELLKAIEVLPSGHIVETDRSGLVGQYIGETAQKTSSVLDKAIGGVLFIDEAYSLIPEDGRHDYGREAVDTILKRMEDDRGKFVVIAAGYRNEMDRFILSNPGLKSRFTTYFHLEDYKHDELYQIFSSMVKKAGFVISEEAQLKAQEVLKEIYNKRDKNFANGRTVRNLFEETTKELALRLSSLSQEERTPEKLNLILPEDIPYKLQEKLSVMDILSQLDSMVGMDNIKKEVRELVLFGNAQMKREEAGAGSASIVPHIILTGNPGTGKTTVARIIGKVFKSIGILPSDNFIEVDKSGLVAQYVGQTSPKVNAVVDRALGGVLFIDEAYTLTPVGQSDSFSQEAIDTLMKRMEDDRGKFVVIAAGYQKDMERFLKSNSGLPSRFTRKFHFEDYKPNELEEIFLKIAAGQGYSISEKAGILLSEACRLMYEERDDNFGNGRDVRNLFDIILQKQSVRLAQLPDSADSALYSVIEAEDFPVKEKKDDSLDAALARLDSLTGLTVVKEEVRQLINYLKIDKLRNDGESASKIGTHYVFTGNPGTGKTTVARILADIFKNMGLIPKGHLVEKDRGGLVGQYVGETAQKTTVAINEAMGGILFVDEAYALTPEGGGKDFGQEAVDTILKRMEDDKGKFIVIAAGYKNEMNRFLNSNPGLLSRFQNIIEFEDYKPDELIAIFYSMAESKKMKMTPEFQEKLKLMINEIFNNRDANFANGRTVRNIFESSRKMQANRVAALSAIEAGDPALYTFEAEDLK